MSIILKIGLTIQANAKAKGNGDGLSRRHRYAGMATIIQIIGPEVSGEIYKEYFG